MVQWIFAVLIFSLVLVVLQALGGKGPTVFGVAGVAGAVLFVALNVGAVLGLYLLYLLVTRDGQAVALQQLVLRLPVVGPCVRALALGRFALALALTMEAGLSIGKALRQSLAATGNAAFTARTDPMVAVIKQGDDLTLALAGSGLFPPDFLAMVAVAEEAGRVPEVMRNQAVQQHEEAARRLKTLTRMAAGLVWLIYVIFMVMMIMQLAGIYLGRWAVGSSEGIADVSAGYLVDTFPGHDYLG